MPYRINGVLILIVRFNTMPFIDVPLFRPRIVNSRGFPESPLTWPQARAVGRLFASILGFQDAVQIVASFRDLDTALGTSAQLKGDCGRFVRESLLTQDELLCFKFFQCTQ